MNLSIVSPVYKGEGMVHPLVDRIIKSVETCVDCFEIILVNDASPDNSWSEILDCCKKDTRIKALNLSRNFGQHSAITAGLRVTQNEWIVVMDCDLQDKPEEITKLLAKAQEGYDAVLAQRSDRQDSFFKRKTSMIYMAIFNYLTDTKQDSSVANFGVYHRKVIDAVLSMGDCIRSFPTMVQWVGFRQCYLPVVHAKRELGSSSYNLKKLMTLAFDSAVSFSDKPLRLMMRMGICLSITAVLVGIFYLKEYITGHIALAGFTTIILSLWFIAGVIIALIGVVGLYIGKIFTQVKQRPIYVVRETINFKQ